MEIIELKPEEFGLEATKAQEISNMFKPMLDKMVELEKEFNVVSQMEQSEEKCILAKELRLKYVKVRTATDTIHRDLKSFYLKGGRFVDGWKNTQRMASENVENDLKAIENYYENLRLEEVKQLQLEREDDLIEYLEENTELPTNLGEMPEEIWLGFLKGMKSNYNERIEQEQKEEADRVENDRLDNIKRERELELANYGDFIDEYPSDLRGMADQDFIDLIEGLKLLKSDKEKSDENARIENEQLKKDNEKKAAENKRIADELQAKKDEEAAKEAKAEEQRQIELNKGDAAKFKDLIAELEAIKGKYEFKSKKNKEMFVGVQTLLDKTIIYIKNK